MLWLVLAQKVLVDIHTTAVGYSTAASVDGRTARLRLRYTLTAELSTRGACAAVRRARVRYDIRLFDPKHRIYDIRCYLGRIYRVSSVFLRAPAASPGVLTYAIIAHATDRVPLNAVNGPVLVTTC